MAKHMKSTLIQGLTIFAMSMVAFGPDLAFASGAEQIAVRSMMSMKPGTAWDTSTLVSGDFNGDGLRDWAMVGYRGSKIELGVRVSARRPARIRTQFLVFGIGSELQAAICEPPAKLQVDEQFCSPMDEALPGCKPTKHANSLNLSGGDCDPIHLYWNSETRKMDWWRL